MLVYWRIVISSFRQWPYTDCSLHWHWTALLVTTYRIRINIYTELSISVPAPAHTAHQPQPGENREHSMLTLNQVNRSFFNANVILTSRMLLDITICPVNHKTCKL